MMEMMAKKLRTPVTREHLALGPMMGLKTGLLMALSTVVVGACASSPPPAPSVPLSSAPPVERRPADASGEANEAFAKGDLEAARRGYQRVVQANPDDLTAVYNLAVTEQRLGNLEAARAGYERVLTKKPSDLFALSNLGAVLKDVGAVDEAIALYRRGLEIAPYDASLLNNLSALYRRKRDYDKAIAAVRRLLMRDQNNLDAYKNLALVYADQKRSKLAQTVLENALKMARSQSREDPDLYVNLGMVFLTQKDAGKAMAAFKKAVELAPDHPVANNNIGALALSNRDYGLAAKSYEVVTRAWPRSSEAASALGYAYQGLQRLPEAAKQLEQARSLKLETAIARADRGTRGSDEEAELLLQLMIIYQNANDADQAIKWGSEYMKLKNLSCGEQDLEGFCGRMNGVRLMKTMASQPAPELEAPKATGRDIFTDGPDEPASGGDPGTKEGEGEPVPADESVGSSP